MEDAVSRAPSPTKSLRHASLAAGLNETKQAAQYIADMALELRNLAKANKLLTLQGLLEVAYYEAFSAAVQKDLPEGEIERLKELSRAANG